MPPRKPLSSRASAVARRGGKGADSDVPQPYGGPTQVGSAPEKRRRPGSGRPPAEEPSEDGDYNEDLYGEDDPFPEEESAEPAVLVDASLRALEPTRLAPLSEDDVERAEDDENATRAGPPLHLEVVSGPDRGKTRRFRGVRMVVGRGHGCDFMLSDGSVSRRHVELVAGDQGVLLRDLGSGNGTRVNGERVNEKLLQDGDEIALGQTRFRFVDELEALRKKDESARKAAEEAAAAAHAAPEQAEGGEPEEEAAPARRRRSRSAARPGLDPRHKRILAGAIGTLVVVIIAVVGFATREPRPPPPNPNAPRAALKMQEARRAVADGRFDEALTLIAAAEELVPGSDVTSLAASTRKELAARQGLEAVRALIREKRFDDARRALAAVPLAIIVGEGERTKVARELERASVDDAVARANAALDAQDVEGAERIIQTLPRAEALALQPRVEVVKQQVAEAALEQEKQERANAAAAKRRAAARRSAHLERAFAAVERKFHAGEFQRAVLECDRVLEQNRGDEELRERARDLKKWIPQFSRSFDEGQKKYRANNLSGAARPLKKARELYSQIGFEGALGPIIDEQLAAASLAAGVASLGRNDLASAAREFKDALALNPSETRAQKGLDTAQQKAEDLYLEAYMLRDRDPREAAARFRTVLEVLPASAPTYKKAKSQLNSLGL